MPIPRSDSARRKALLVVLALGALYFVWGSTYIAMHFAMHSFPPFIMAALRFMTGGGLLYGWLRLRGSPVPNRAEWLGAAAVGSLLLVFGNAAVAYAQQTVASGAAALTIATVPLWMALFSGLWEQWPNRREWLGILIGTVGVIVLNLGGNMQASPLGAALLLLASASWAFGSAWGKHLAMPAGAMGSASQMLVAGALLAIVSAVSGEQWPADPSLKSLLAIAYLVVFGSLVAYSAYLYLLKTVRPALATSYALVNPLVALFLGVWLADEQISGYEYAALAIIVTGVLLVLPLKRNS